MQALTGLLGEDAGEPLDALLWDGTPACGWLEIGVRLLPHPNRHTPPQVVLLAVRRLAAEEQHPRLRLGRPAPNGPNQVGQDIRAAAGGDPGPWGGLA